MGFLNALKLRKSIIEGTQSHIPFSSYKHPYLSPTCSTTWCQKYYSERPQSVETKRKMQEEKRKLKRTNWKGNLLIIEMGAWKRFLSTPPPLGGGGETITPTPLLPLNKILGKVGFYLVRLNSRVNNSI